ncbi:MAG TPA: glycosyltransferase family 4 protein, partial [Ktedonobacterales bacterium]|nr:glycosyltransferase family 4 protein [Ktedonobacterales bacterium]
MRERPEQRFVKARILMVIGALPNAKMWADIAAGRSPGRDYDALRIELGADALYPSDLHASLVGKLLLRVLGRQVTLALAAFLRRGEYDTIYCDSEGIGLPLAMLLKLARVQPGRLHLVILAHYLSPFKKRIWFRLGVGNLIDRLIVHASSQHALAVGVLGMPEEKVMRLPYFADTRFWNRNAVDSGNARPSSEPLNYVCSVGLEFRDYPTLVEAVRGLPVRVRIAAASEWSHHSPLTNGRTIPENVHIRRYDSYDLRRLYAGARFMVLPLLDVDNQAGITALLEAMSMGKAVIVSRTRGQTDVVRGWRAPDSKQVEPVPGFLDIPGITDTLGHLPTGYYVPPGDPEALRAAIQQLLADPALAEELGRNARRVMETIFSLEAFTRRFAAVIRDEKVT